MDDELDDDVAILVVRVDALPLKRDGHSCLPDP